MIRGDHAPAFRCDCRPVAEDLQQRRSAHAGHLPAEVPVLPHRHLRMPELVSTLPDPLLALPTHREPAGGGAPLTEAEFDRIEVDVAALLETGAGADATQARHSWLDDRRVRELASAAHGSETAIEAAVVGIALLRAASVASTMSDIVEPIRCSGLLDGVLDEAVPLAELGRSHSARSALRGGVAVAIRCADGSPAAVRHALHEIRGATVPAAVGPVAGALLGAVYGVEALPVDLLGRLELGWAIDTLARDLVSQDLDHPGGSEYVEASDPHWWARYPGW